MLWNYFLKLFKFHDKHEETLGDSLEKGGFYMRANSVIIILSIKGFDNFKF